MFFYFRVRKIGSYVDTDRRPDSTYLLSVSYAKTKLQLLVYKRLIFPHNRSYIPLKSILLGKKGSYVSLSAKKGDEPHHYLYFCIIVIPKKRIII